MEQLDHSPAWSVFAHTRNRPVPARFLHTAMHIRYLKSSLGNIDMDPYNREGVKRGNGFAGLQPLRGAVSK